MESMRVRCSFGISVAEAKAIAVAIANIQTLENVVSKVYSTYTLYSRLFRTSFQKDGGGGRADDEVKVVTGNS